MSCSTDYTEGSRPITVANGSELLERYMVELNPCEGEKVPLSLVGKTVTAKAANMHGKVVREFKTEIEADAVGAFTVSWDLREEHMTVGTYKYEVVVVDDFSDESLIVGYGPLEVTRESL